MGIGGVRPDFARAETYLRVFFLRSGFFSHSGGVMKRVSGQTKKSISVVVMVAVVAAVAFFGYSWWSARSVASGKKALSPILFSVGLVVTGMLSLSVKKMRMVAAPLMVVGAALAGVELVRSAVPLSGASRYRLGQNRPAPVIGMNRPADVVSMNRPVNMAPARWGSGRAAGWGAARA